MGIIFATIYLGGREIDDVVRHVEHALDVAGEDAVAFGSDFDGMVPLPRGMRDVTGVPLVVSALARRRPARSSRRSRGGTGGASSTRRWGSEEGRAAGGRDNGPSRLPRGHQDPAEREPAREHERGGDAAHAEVQARLERSRGAAGRRARR